MYAELLKTPQHYSKLTPVKVAAAEARARELYQRFDRLVDEVQLLPFELYQARKWEVDDAYENYKAAQAKADRLRRAYMADPNPARWF